MVVATRLTQEALSRQLLMAMFGLTPAEARLAAEIAAGQRLDALAEAHHVTLPTLRTQLRAIYGKTGTSRQSELVRLLAALPPVRRGT
jgi:DNA-binding CsgD family transcriptional regulator